MRSSEPCIPDPSFATATASGRRIALVGPSPSPLLGWGGVRAGPGRHSPAIAEAGRNVPSRICLEPSNKTFRRGKARNTRVGTSKGLSRWRRSPGRSQMAALASPIRPGCADSRVPPESIFDQGGLATCSVRRSPGKYCQRCGPPTVKGNIDSRSRVPGGRGVRLIHEGWAHQCGGRPSGPSKSTPSLRNSIPTTAFLTVASKCGEFEFDPNSTGPVPNLLCRGAAGGQASSPQTSPKATCSRGVNRLDPSSARSFFRRFTNASGLDLKVGVGGGVFNELHPARFREW